MTKTASPSKDLVPVERLTPADLMGLLRQTGMAQTSASNFRRMKVEGGMLVTLDGQGEVENQYPPRFDNKTKSALPAATVRIVSPAKYYNGFWLDSDESRGGFDATRIGHPELNKSFSRRYDNPQDQESDASPANQYFDQIAEATGSRGRFQADIRVQIVPEDGQMTGEETVYTLTLSPSAALDFRGTRKNPEGGVVQDKNFIVQLSEFAMEQAIENGANSKAELEKAVLDAMEAYKLGLVVADIYLLRAENDDGSNVWTIPAFKPVHIEPLSDTPALASGNSGDDPGF